MGGANINKPIPMENLLSIFYAEFDNKIGPVLLNEYPEEVIGQEMDCNPSPNGVTSVQHGNDQEHQPAVVRNSLFNGISQYVITNKDLCGNLITISAGGYKVVSYPLSVEDEKYERSRFSFSFGMVFKGNASAGPFKPLLRKLGNSMLALELENQYLSEPTTKRCVGQLVKQVFTDLRNNDGECMVPVNKANTVALKLIPRHIDPEMVEDYQVPVRTVNFDNYLTKEWDLTIQYIIPHIDGAKYVKRIALDADVDTTLVRRGLRQLMYYKCVEMVDIFQYSNRYRCAERFREFAMNERWQRECCKYVGRENTLPFEFCPKLVQLYSEFQPHLRLGDFCLIQDTAGINIDDLKFVTFGVAYGIIRRVHLYPVLPLALRESRLKLIKLKKQLKKQREKAEREAEEKAKKSSSATGVVHVPRKVPAANIEVDGKVVTEEISTEDEIVAMSDGSNSLDKICCQVMRSHVEVELILQNQLGCSTLFK